MKPINRVVLLIILSLLTGLSWQIGYAQTQPNIRLDSAEIRLLPEFNQPSVLVIYEIDLDPSLSVPQDLIVSVPLDAQILNVVNFTPEDRPLELPYQETRIGNWKDLLLSPSHHRIRIEYKDPNLVRQGNSRFYEFRWLSVYPVSALSVVVRQPLGASQINSEIPLTPIEDRFEGDAYYSADFGAIPPGELMTFSFSYTKTIGELAYPALIVKPAKPIDETTLGRTPSPESVILWLIVASLAMGVTFGLYYWWIRTNVADQSERIHQGVGLMNPEKQTSFCHECGMRSNPGDSFCSNCGTELHKANRFEKPPR